VRDSSIDGVSLATLEAHPAEALESLLSTAQ
jgi:hypothetical protein